MTHKRKRGEFEASQLIVEATMGIAQPHMALTHSKMTRRRQEVELQITFLQEGFRLRPSAPWPSIKNLKRDSYPVIIRRRMLTIDEQRRVIWLRFGSLESMERRWHSATEVWEMTGVS
jgi:hypothetical protein